MQTFEMTTFFKLTIFFVKRRFYFEGKINTEHNLKELLRIYAFGAKSQQNHVQFSQIWLYSLRLFLIF